MRVKVGRLATPASTVHTSAGRYRAGESVDLPEGEAMCLASRGLVECVAELQREQPKPKGKRRAKNVGN